MWNEIYRAISPEQWRQFLILIGVVAVAGIILEIIQKRRR